MQLKGKLQTFGLTEDPAEGRKYLTVDVNFGLLRNFFDKRVYDPFTNEGEQRIAKDRHITKLRNDISAGEYTPASFNACVRSLDNVTVEGRNVSIEVDENNKLVLLDGGSRFAALDDLRQSGDTKLSRKVDNLPIPIIIYLDPAYAKRDFIHLQMGLPVSRSQLLSMKIAEGYVAQDKDEYFKLGQNLAILLQQDENSPIVNQISFGNVTGGRLAYNALISDRARDVSTSLYGSAKVLSRTEKDTNFFLSNWRWLIDYANENTDATKSGKLLQLDGPKGCINNWIGVVNVWLYYLDLVERTEPTEQDLDQLREALRVYESDVNKDLSSTRKCTLIGAFTQRLFSLLEEDPECMTGFHCGIPLTLLVLMGKGSAFGVENPDNLSARHRKAENPEASEVGQASVDSDTDLEFLK